MSAAQIAFLAFATAQASPCTPLVTQAAPALVAQPVVADGGECIRPRKFSWLVTVTFADGAIRSFRWYRLAAARACLRDFGSAKKELFRCYGYSTWEGWRDVSFPLPLSV